LFIQQELVFHNDDGSCQVVVVERNLRASDLCQLLALKNRVAKDVSWTIVEQWVDLGLGECHRMLFNVYFATVSLNIISKYGGYASFKNGRA
jgi:hypothetical protein